VIKARNTIKAYLIPDFRKWRLTGRGEDEEDDPLQACGNVTG